MTEFISSERRTLAAAFDRHREQTDTVLRDPRVAAELGQLSTRLIEMNNNSFLPNSQSDGFVLPESQKSQVNTAVLPLKDADAVQFEGFLQPLINGAFQEWAEPEGYSPVYGVDTKGSLAAKYADHIPSSRSPLAGGALARTVTVIGRYEGTTTMVSSRPILLVRREAWQDEVEIGATGAHELVHAVDLSDEAPLYPTNLYSGASELRAYHASASVYRAFDEQSLHCATSLEIDALRQQAIGHTPFPYAPTAELMDVMIARNVV